MVVLTNSTQSSSNIQTEIIGIYKIFTVYNVESYRNCDNNFNNWIIQTTNENISTDDNIIYFIIDTFFNEAFGHWVFESAVYLDLFLLLKQRYPSIKLHFKTQRAYKSLFCSLFGIKNDDIVYNLEKKNRAIFPSPIQLMNSKIIVQDYIQQLEVFFLRIKGFKSVSKEIKTLIVPRQSKENYKPNDRKYNMDPIIDIYNTSASSYEVLHTDTITDLKEQIRKISSANTIIITDGSPFLVNGMFSENSHILVIDTHTKKHQMFQPNTKQILENIKLINNTTFEYFNTVTDVVQHLNSA